MTNLEHRVYIYAFDSQNGDLLDKHYLHDTWITIRNIMLEAALMDEKFHNKVTIYVADGTRELAKAAMDMQRTKLFEDKVVFRTLVEEQGVRIM